MGHPLHKAFHAYLRPYKFNIRLFDFRRAPLLIPCDSALFSNWMVLGIPLHSNTCHICHPHGQDPVCPKSTECVFTIFFARNSRVRTFYNALSLGLAVRIRANARAFLHRAYADNRFLSCPNAVREDVVCEKIWVLTKCMYRT